MKQRCELQANANWSALSFFLLLVGLTPIALVCWYVVTQGSVVPSGDQWWDPVYIAVKTAAGTLALEDFFVLNTGHRPVVTRIITAISTIFTNYDARPLRFTAFVLTITNLGLTLFLLKLPKTLVLAAFCLLSILLFTLYYPPNWLDMPYSGWQQAFFFMLLGLVVLQRMRPGWPAFLLVALCATTASFAYASGLAAWFSLPIAAAEISEYRRRSYVVIWILLLALFLLFYVSDYAVPVSEKHSLSIHISLRYGLLSPFVYLFRFLAIRFEGLAEGLIFVSFTLLSALVMGVNFWRVYGTEAARSAFLLASLAAYSVGTAGLSWLARGDVPWTRYSPGSDGFWIAVVGFSFLALSQRPRAYMFVLNVGLLLALAALSIRTDIRGPGALQSLPDAQESQLCDDSVLNYPLVRDATFHNCFIWSEDQSVYHLAAFRLSVFRNERARLVLPRTDGIVISDMPNRWLSVYVRDFMMAGLPWEKLYSIAPTPGNWPVYNEPYSSPFNRGEWSTDIIPKPLGQVWDSADGLMADLETLAPDRPMIWYLNTPETEANFSAVEGALAKLGYSGAEIGIDKKQYASARFGLRCFERIGSNACAVHEQVPAASGF
jgi:hypothetical protein